MREFDTGATRDSDTDKYDYEGFINPLALERYAQYMNKHRVQADGKVRDSDNWQKGMPISAYMKSMWRHMMAAWKVHRGYPDEANLEESLCAVIFNAFGYLTELQIDRQHPSMAAPHPAPLPVVEGGHCITLPNYTHTDMSIIPDTAIIAAKPGGAHQHPRWWLLDESPTHEHDGFPPHHHDKDGWMIPLTGAELRGYDVES